MENYIAYWAFLCESEDTFLLEEDKKAYFLKYGNQPDFTDVIQKFWYDIRHKLKVPLNDIDYWAKRPYSDLRDFVNSYDNDNVSTRRNKKYVENAKRSGARLLGQRGGYEIWYVPTYEAAKQLGRFYMGHSAKWCISTDFDKYFKEDYGESEFVLLIRKSPMGDVFDKIALQIDDFGKGPVVSWDMANKRNTFSDDSIIEYAKDLFNSSGLSRNR